MDTSENRICNSVVRCCVLMKKQLQKCLFYIKMNLKPIKDT